MRKFLDTAPFIYVIEGHSAYADKVVDLISESLSRGDFFTTSVYRIRIWS